MATIDFGYGQGNYVGTSGDDTFVTTSVAFQSPTPPWGSIDGGDGYDTIDVRGVSPASLGLGQKADGSFAPVLDVGNQYIEIHSIENFEFGDSANYIDITRYLGAGVTVDAGGGNDNITAELPAFIEAGAGDDSIFISGVFAVSGPTQYGSVDGGSGYDTLKLNNEFHVDLAAGTATSGLASYTISSIEHVSGSISFDGGSVVSGSDANEVFDVWYDPSYITTATGVTYDGRGGDDTITGSSHNDSLTGGYGHDVINGGYGDDIIYGNQGDDVLYGNQGNDTIYGGQDNDTVYGGQGDDVLHGNLGNDVLEGGVGNDMIYGDDGIDTAAYTAATSGVTVSLLLQGQAQDTVGAGIDTLFSIENLTGSSYADTLTGDAGDNVLTGGYGNDVLNGGYGNDTLYGNQDNDVLYGNQGNDTLYGGQGDDTLYGGQNDDVLVGGLGNDILVGGLGNDIFKIDANFGHDTITDFSAIAGNNDVIEFTAGTFANYSDVVAHMAQVGDNVVITLDGNDSVTLNNVTVAAMTADHFVFG